MLGWVGEEGQEDRAGPSVSRAGTWQPGVVRGLGRGSRGERLQEVGGAAVTRSGTPQQSSSGDREEALGARLPGDRKGMRRQTLEAK